MDASTSKPLRSAIPVGRGAAVESRSANISGLLALWQAVCETQHTGHGMESLFKEACRAAVERGEFLLAWLGMVETGKIQPVASYGRDAGYIETLISSPNGIASGNGPIGRALRSGKIAVSNDMLADPGIVHKQAAAERSIYSCAAFPLVCSDRVRAVFVIYAGTRDYFQDGETAILSRTAEMLALAIRTNETELRLQDQAAWINHAQEAIRMCDLEGRILAWNKSSSRLFGWSEAEVAGRRQGDILPVQRERFAEITKQVLDISEWSGELTLENREGDPVVLDSRWSLLRDGQSQPRGILVIETDITERKKLEIEFLRSQRLDSIGALACGIAHDLNNVLSPVLLALGLLRSQPNEERASSAVDIAERNVRTAINLVQHICMFARGADGPVGQIEPVELLGSLKVLVSDTFPRTISVDIKAQDGTLPIFGDFTQLEQVLLNLCVNARDAMNNCGRLEVTAFTHAVEPIESAKIPGLLPGCYTVFEVRDSGFGIPEELLPHIFTPFFTTKKEGRGTGIGLSTAQKIVRKHSGVITAQSTPGSGATFTIYLPALARAAASNDAPASTEMLKGQGEVVMILETEASIRLIMHHVLAAFGYQVLAISKPENAGAVLQKQNGKVELVVADLDQEGSDALLSALFAHNPAIRILAMANQPASTRPMANQAFLQKPFRPEQFLHAVRTAISKQ